jgi:RNA polymerase sigma-70 factor (family 1)
MRSLYRFLFLIAYFSFFKKGMNYCNLSDIELTELLKEGDHFAYAEIYKRYSPLLFVHAFKKIRNIEEAKDVIQEVFTSIWTKRSDFIIKTNLAGYLYSCVHNSILNFITRQKIQTKYIESLHHFLTERSAADDRIREKDLANIIDKEISALPAKMRAVFELSRRDYLTHKQIAKKLNLSEETVKCQVKNALKILKLRLGFIVYITFLIGYYRY